MPSTIYPIPYTLYSVPYILYPTPYILYPITICPIPYTLCPMPYALYPIPCTLNPEIYTLHCGWSSARAGLRRALAVTGDCPGGQVKPCSLNPTPSIIYPRTFDFDP